MTAYRLDPSSGALVPLPEPAGLPLPAVTPCTVDYCGEPAWSRKGRCRAHYAAALRVRAMRDRRRAAWHRRRGLPTSADVLDAQAIELEARADRIEAGR